MPHTTAISPLAAASRSASGVGPVVDLGAATTVALVLEVTSASSLDLAAVVETARSATAVTWREAHTFTIAHAPITIERTVAGLDRYTRVRWTMSGTATFGLSGSAVLVYCTPADMRRVIAAQALVRDQRVEYSDVDLDAYAQDATDDVNTEALAPLYKLPVTAWPRNVRMKTAELAVFYAIRHRGNSTEDEAGKAYRQMHDDVMKWCERVRGQEVELDGIVDQTPEVEEGGAYAVVGPTRGWSSSWGMP